jgi:hypothetical protein
MHRTLLSSGLGATHTIAGVFLEILKSISLTKTVRFFTVGCTYKLAIASLLRVKRFFLRALFVD